jgi:hypothetical protein
LPPGAFDDDFVIYFNPFDKYEKLFSVMRHLDINAVLFTRNDSTSKILLSTPEAAVVET